MLRQLTDAPTFDEVADQIAKMRECAQRLAWLAQGGTGGSPVPDAGWWLEPQSEVPERRKSEALWIEFSSRSASLHPMIQRGIGMVIPFVRIIPLDTKEPPLPVFLRNGAVGFFDQLPELINHFAKAETRCRERAKQEGFDRKGGRKNDPARDWALIRLMWIARDVLDIPLTSYRKRTHKRVALDKPEPNVLLSFVIDAMAHIEPIGPGDLGGLERALADLRPQVPDTPIASSISREN